MMTRILFICHDNICRSPMAEFVMKDLAKKARMGGWFYIESAATSAEEIGRPIHPQAVRKLSEHGIVSVRKTARQLTGSDYVKFDLLIGMEQSDLRNMQRICGGDPRHKMRLLMDYTGCPGDVTDPRYTGDFETAWRNILTGCRGLMHKCKEKFATL